MAIYTSDSYNRRKKGGRMWLSLALVVLIAVIVVAFILGYIPFGNKETENIPEEPVKEVKEQKIIQPVKVVEPVKQDIVKPKPKPVPQVNVPEVSPAEVPDSNSQTAKLINEAIKLLDSRPERIIEARKRLNDALMLPMSQSQRTFVKSKLSELSEKWLFSKTVYPNDELCGSYKVQPGDLLSTIGKKNNVPYEILLQINNIKRPELLQAGQTIKLVHGPFNARIYRSTFTMDLFLKNTFVKSFPVGLGKPAHETPTGLWIVKAGGKLIKPAWTDPDTNKRYEPDDPDYPLGSRWIGLEGVRGAAKGRTGFAIHGTKVPDEIGAATSRGCIRLHNGNAILAYNLLTEGMSQVEVID